MNQKVDKIMQEAKKLRIRTKNLIIEDHLNYQKSKINASFSLLICQWSYPYVSSMFKQSYSQLNNQQKSKWYLMNVKITRQLNIYKKISLSSNDEEKQTIDCWIKIQWVKCKIDLNTKERTINIHQINLEIDLHFYISRQSKKQGNFVIVLLKTHHISELPQKIKIKVEPYRFDFLQKSIMKLFELTVFDNFRKILGQNQQSQYIQQRQNNIKSLHQIKNKNSLQQQPVTLILCKNSQKFKNNKINYNILIKNSNNQQKIQYNNLQIIKDFFLLNNIVLSFDNWIDWKYINNGIYQNQDKSKIRLLYNFKIQQYSINKICNQIIKCQCQFQEQYFTIFIQILYTLSKQKSIIYHKIIKYKSLHLISYLFIRHHIIINNSQQYFIDKSLNNKAINFILKQNKFKYPINKNLGFIHQCIWRIRNIDNKIELFIQAKITHKLDQLNTKLNQYYFYNFSKNSISNNISQKYNNISFQQQQLSQISFSQQNKTQFYTMKQNSQFSFNQNNNQIEKQQQQLFTEKFSNIKSYNNNNITYLKYKNIIQPQPKTVSKLQKVQGNYQHFIWGKDWQPNIKGQLLPCDQLKIDAQNQVLIKFLKMLGKDLFSGKNFSHTSLPVDIFGEHTNLTLYCHSMVYAPILLESAALEKSNLQRFKKVIAYSIGTIIASLRIEKQFNPIIGETYQGMIDGCPVYAQQISHHPPISSVLFKGRGFTIFANYQPQVNIGFFGVKGINLGETKILFDKDKEENKVVRYSPFAGQLKWNLYSRQRKLYLTGKSAHFDEATLLFCELKCGKNEKIFESKYNFYHDFVWGKIVKLKTQTQLKLLTQIKGKNYEQQYGLIHGRWTHQLFYNDEIIFDSFTMIPHQIQDCYRTCESDSIKRKDLQYRIANNLQQSQNAKVQIQQLQRKDVKLRKCKYK